MIHLARNHKGVQQLYPGVRKVNLLESKMLPYIPDRMRLQSIALIMQVNMVQTIADKREGGQSVRSTR